MPNIAEEDIADDTVSETSGILSEISPTQKDNI